MIPSRRHQQGVSLLEALISILIFAVGILAVVALQAASIRTSNDAKFRADASYLANQLVGRMWTDRANLANYAHNATGAFVCDTRVGTAVATPANASLNAWLQTVNSTLPGGSNGAQRVVVDATTNLVTITMCWRAGSDARDTRRFDLSTQIAG
jgi:type IV pilus assembly protein PilV